MALHAPTDKEDPAVTSTHHWPTEVREAAIRAHAVARNVPFPSRKDEREVDAVLAALAQHAVPRAPLDALAQQWDEERFPGGLRNPQRMADAIQLRHAMPLPGGPTQEVQS